MNALRAAILTAWALGSLPGQQLTYTVTSFAGGRGAQAFTEGQTAATVNIFVLSLPAVDRLGNIYFRLDARIVRLGTGGLVRNFA